VVTTQKPSQLGPKVAWGAIGGVLQGNVYFLTTASKMAVVDFPEACTLGIFWVYTVAFIVIASTGLAVNALAMRFYKATFCVCSFVGEWGFREPYCSPTRHTSPKIRQKEKGKISIMLKALVFSPALAFVELLVTIYSLFR
jgi:hypothetical protein